MSSEEPTKRATMGAAAKVDRSSLAPMILVPTPAQLAAGVRVIESDPATWPAAVARCVKRAREYAWDVRVSYSHVLDVPPVAGRHKGEWVPRHFLAVRLERFGVQAYGTWMGMEEAGWKFERAQARLVHHWPTKCFSSRELDALLAGTLGLEEMIGGYRLAPAAAV